MSEPFFSIITVAYKDAWALTKTARSVFCQSFSDFEYIVVDGNSNDGTAGLVEFWEAASLINRSCIEPDRGVYDAMNKGVSLARGQFLCFMNAGDLFANDDVLSRVHDVLSTEELDGCLGWGELNGQIWASWCESSAFKLSSLGFCHQSLYVRRQMLKASPFDDRPHKTDSDTLQLGRLYEANANIKIVPEVWALRGGEPGISANLDRTKTSIADTIVSEYPSANQEVAESILAFRRRGEQVSEIGRLLQSAPMPLRSHLACMVLDTAFQRPSLQIDSDHLLNLVEQSIAALEKDEDVDVPALVDRLVNAQTMRAAYLSERAERADLLKKEIVRFSEQEDQRFASLISSPHRFSGRPEGDYIVALTSFPARIRTLHFVVRALVEQTCPPSEIHLYLGKDEIPNKNWLPRQLLAFEDRGLHVHFETKTCHQYDKFLHGFDLNATRPYVIVDDDVIYHPYSMATLLEGHKQFPRTVVANRCHRMEVHRDGTLGPYANWKREQCSPNPSLALMPTGAGGVLYPPGFLNSGQITDVDLILSHAPYADDVWLKFCALAQNVPTFATALSAGANWYVRYTPTMRAGTLMATNVSRGLNDIQIQRCAEWLDGVNPGWRERLILDSKCELAT